jgi:hypothetical protein
MLFAVTVSVIGFVLWQQRRSERMTASRAAQEV